MKDEDKVKLREKFNEIATKELIEEGLMRQASDGQTVWTERGMIEAWKTWMKFHQVISGTKNIRIRKD